MGIIIFVMALLSLRCVDGGIIYIKTTPQHYQSTNYVILGDYGYVTETSMVFQIMSCSSAYIILTASDSTVYYQFVVQGWGNTKSEIRRKSGSSTRESKSHSESNLFDCNAYKKFRISWGNDKIELDKSVDCVWVNMISMARHSSIPESNIQRVGIMSSTYATNQPSHWRIHTRDQTLKLNTPASSDNYFLNTFGYDIGISVSITFLIKVCDRVTITFLKNAADMLYKVELRSNEGLLSDNQGASDQMTGIVQNCNSYRSFKFSWSGNSIVLEHSYSGNTLTASLTKQNEDIKFIRFQSDSSTFWTWEIDAAGAHFTMDSSCIETTTARPTTTTLLTTTTSPPSTTTQPPTTTTTTQFPSTTQPTTTSQPTTTTEQTTTTTELPTTTTEQPATTTQEQTTTTEMTSTTTETTSQKSSTSIVQGNTTVLETTTLPLTTMPATVQNACCCVVYNAVDEPVDLTSVMVLKKETSRYKRSLTSASDDRPSAAYIGYAGSGFLLFITIGIVLVDLPNLVGMVRIMKANIQSGLRRK